jgi:hypothetical protein
MVGMGTLLTDYVSAVRAAADTMLASDRDAERQPAGYKELELALREQIRRLRDLSTSLSLDARQPVDAALDVATSVRDEIFRRLFPQPSQAVPPTLGPQGIG